MGQALRIRWLAAEQGRGQRAFRAQPVENLLAGALGHVVPPQATFTERAPAERVVGPLLDRQHACRVRPVLEGPRVAGIPVRPFDTLSPNRAEPSVGDQLVRSRQHADRVELNGANAPEHGADTAAPLSGAEKALGPQGDPANLVAGEGELRRGRGSARGRGGVSGSFGEGSYHVRDVSPGV